MSVMFCSSRVFIDNLKARGASAVHVAQDLMTLDVELVVFVGGKRINYPPVSESAALVDVYTKACADVQRIKTIEAVKRRMKGKPWQPD